MKKPYKKPMVSFEDYALDMPIAAGCFPGATDVLEELKAMNYFAEGCYDELTDDALRGIYGDDKICYFSMTSNLFTS